MKIKRKVTPLKIAILESGMTQTTISEKSSVNGGTLSRAANGWRRLTTEEQRKVAAALRMPIRDLFPDDK